MIAPWARQSSAKSMECDALQTVERRLPDGSFARFLTKSCLAATGPTSDVKLLGTGCREWARRGQSPSPISNGSFGAIWNWRRTTERGANLPKRSVGPVQEPSLLAGHTVAVAIEVGTVTGRASPDWSRTRCSCRGAVRVSATARHHSQHSRGRPRRATAPMTVIVASFPVVVTPGRVEAARMRRGRRAHPSDRNDTGRHGPAELPHTSPPVQAARGSSGQLIGAMLRFARF